LRRFQTNEHPDLSIQSQSDSWTSENSTDNSSDIDDERPGDFVFEDDIPTSQEPTRLSKGKFKEPPSNIAEAFEDNFEDDSLSSNGDGQDDLSDDLQNTPAFNYNAPEIDPETFDPPIGQDESQQNMWVILWLMKFQKQFNLPDTSLDALIKFIRRVFQHYHIKDADKLPTSIFTAKSSLGFATKYREYGMCQECFTLYNPTDLKNYKEDDQPTVKLCDHVEFPQHRSKKKRLPCGKPLTQTIVTQKGSLLRPLSIYPVGSIKQQLYMMYQRPGFEKMLRHSRRRNVPEGVFSDIYEGHIWRTFSIDPNNPNPFFAKDTLDTHIGLAINVDWFQPYQYTTHSTGAIYGVLCNLPREVRFKPENILTLSIIPGPHEPKQSQINNILAPIVDELLQFAQGVYIPSTYQYPKGRKIYLALILSANDIPAARKICGHAGPGVKCHRCPKRATYDKITKRNHYGNFRNAHEWFQPVDIGPYREAARQWLHYQTQYEREKHFLDTGVRWSELYRLNYFNPVTFMVVDPMHCLFLGVGKWIIKKLLLANEKLTKQQCSTIDQRMKIVKVPSDIGRIPSKVAQGDEGFSKFTADQWRIFFQVYAIPCMWDMLDNGDRAIIFHFVRACNLLVSRIVRQTCLDEAHYRLLTMAQLIEEHYGSAFISPNIHLSLHIKQCCLDYGPPYAYWCYSFERMNGFLGS
jgi:hypothetical protein